MQRFNTRARNAIEVGSFHLENLPREEFDTTPELHAELSRLLKLVPEYSIQQHNMHNLLSTDEHTSRSTLFTYKHHPGNRFEDNPPPLYQEIDLRFTHGIVVEERGLLIQSIFHTKSVAVDDETKTLEDWPRFYGGRKVMGWRTGGLPIPFTYREDQPEGVPRFDTLDDLQSKLEDICPATPEGMVIAFSRHLQFEPITV